MGSTVGGEEIYRIFLAPTILISFLPRTISNQVLVRLKEGIGCQCVRLLFKKVIGFMMVRFLISNLTLAKYRKCSR